MTIQRVLHFALAFLVIGAAFAIAFYLLTGTSEYTAPIVNWSPGPVAHRERFAQIPGLVFGYCIDKWLLALVEGLLLTWLVSRRAKARLAVLASVSLAVAADIAGTPLHRGWIASAIAAIAPGCSWVRPDFGGEHLLGGVVAFLLPLVLTSLTAALYSMALPQLLANWKRRAGT